MWREDGTAILIGTSPDGICWYSVDTPWDISSARFVEGKEMIAAARKYTFKEIKEKLKDLPDEDDSLSVSEILDIMKESMAIYGIDEDDAVWEWPGKEDTAEDAYDRAMSIL